MRTSPEGTVRRRPGDLVRVALAALAVGLLALHAGHTTPTEAAVVRFFDSLPKQATSLFVLLYNLVALWALALVVTATVLLRRWRLVRDLAIAGAAAWFIGRLLAFWIGNSSFAHAMTVVLGLTDAPRFPLVRLGVAVAVVTVASPHLTRPVRLVGDGLVVVLAFTAMYLDRGTPTDLLGAVALGWGLAALVHLVFGTADRRPTAVDVAAVLRAARVAVRELRPAPVQAAGRALFVADGDAALQVIALGRDEAETQLLARAWRWVTLRDVSPVLFPMRRQQVEYEAYVTLLAHDRGVCVPRVLAVVSSGPVAVLALRLPAGRLLGEVPSDAVDDATLDAIWKQLQQLHSARVAHGHLDAHHVVVDGSPALVGFEAASTAVRSGQMDADVAQLLATTAPIVGTERAVAAAVRGVGEECVAAALPVLQPAALPSATREVLDDGAGIDHELEELREAGAAATHSEAPQVRELHRVAPRTLLMAIGALIGIGVLLSRVGNPATFWASIRDANWAFVAAAFGAALLTDVAFAVAFLGTVPLRLSPWPAIELQSSLSFLNLAVPVAADTVAQVRFLQKAGLDVSSAVATGGVLSTVTETTIQVGLFFLALWLAPNRVSIGRIDTSKLVVIMLGVVLLLGVAAAVVASIRRVRRMVLPHVMSAARSVWDAVKSPWRMTLVIVGNVAAQFLYAITLLLCLHAFGASVSLWTLVALNIGISTIASLVPVPGGATAVSAIGLSGMLVTLGVGEAAAAAAVLTQQVVGNYLTAAPGWFAMRDLVRTRRL